MISLTCARLWRARAELSRLQLKDRFVSGAVPSAPEDSRMADVRTKRTGEYNAQIVTLMADAASMRDHIAALEARIVRLESAAASARKATSVAAPPRPAPAPPPMPPAAPSPAPAPSAERSSKRPPAPVGPPPLPKMMPAIPKPVSRRSVVDISEIAELVESIPPPPPRSRR